MATFEEVRERLRQEHGLDVDEPGELAVTLALRSPAGEPRAQRVMVRLCQSWGRDMLEIRSAFGQQGDYDPVELLRDNLNLPLGAVALHEGYLVLVYKASLEDLTLDGTVFLVRQVGFQADVLEGRRGGDRY